MFPLTDNKWSTKYGRGFSLY